MFKLKFLKIIIIISLLVHFSTPTYSVVAYTDCDGIEDGDTALFEYEGKIQSTGEVFDSTEDGAIPFTITADGLIQGFYEGVLGMKIGERKTITIPPNKGYTNPDNAPDGLYGETLIFDVYLEDVISGERPCDGEIPSDSSTENLSSSNSSIAIGNPIGSNNTMLVTILSFILLSNFIVISRKREFKENKL